MRSSRHTLGFFLQVYASCFDFFSSYAVGCNPNSLQDRPSCHVVAPYENGNMRVYPHVFAFFIFYVLRLRLISWCISRIDPHATAWHQMRLKTLRVYPFSCSLFCFFILRRRLISWVVSRIGDVFHPSFPNVPTPSFLNALIRNLWFFPFPLDP